MAPAQATERMSVAGEFRVGIGYDIHRLGEDRRLILGGVEIDYPLGLLGHSDGDVVLHAVTDALLGAAGLPDMGDLFPDTDPAYKGIDSSKLLAQAMDRVSGAGFAANNIDLIVHAEKPKLSEHKRAIGAAVARLTGLDPAQVSVKAKTNEGLGPLGHADGIACTAIATAVRDH